MDLRSRLLAAVDSGSSCRAAAARFGVAPSTAIRWRAQQRETGDFAPTVSGLWNLIGKLVDIFQADECANYFRSCGYEPE
jgi:transposase-like protein